MHVGVHLPQYGRVASAEAVTRAARHAEDLGFAGLWVSDHTVHPAAQDYPSPYLYDPLVTLSWAAAVTSTIGLGTSVLVVPQHNPLELANALASLDNLSGGRLTAGVGVGWSAAEFAALGYGFSDRGKRTDETLRLWRTVWRDDPASFDGEHVNFTDIRLQPKPAHDIPIWVGGSGERAYRRAVELGDGYQFVGATPEQVGAPIARLRADRPEDAFTISLRTGWDPLGMDAERIKAERQAFTDAGISYVVAAPWQRNVEDWLRSLDALASLAELSPA